MSSRTITGMAAMSAREKLVKYEFEARSLRANDVEVKVSHCGICHSDVHLIDGEWGDFCQYPKVAGHELVGEVTAVGDHVQGLSPGMRVGIGWWKDACGKCNNCKAGDEQMCDSGVPTCALGENGGFANYWRGSATGVFRIPDALDSASVAPLLCGGITVYTPLAEYTQPSHRVGILGIGGLGHMAVQFARARGCHVTALTSTASKEEEAKKLGAHEVVVTRDADALKAAANSLDILLVTVTVPLDWEPYINMLRNRGTLIFVGAVPEPVKLTVFGPLLMKMLRVVGSITGGRRRIEEMLEFAARHSIGAQVERMPLENVNEALEKVRGNQARYRMVLTMGEE